MIGKFKIEDPDSIRATLEITMSLKEWSELRDQLKREWPSSELSSIIADLLSQGSKVFYSESVL